MLNASRDFLMKSKSLRVLSTLFALAVPGICQSGPALRLDIGTGSVTVDQFGNQTYTGICSAATCGGTPTVSSGSISWTGGIGDIHVAHATGLTKPAFAPPALDLALVLTTGSVGGSITISFTDTDFPTGGNPAGVNIVPSFIGSTTYHGYADNSNVQFGQGVNVASTNTGGFIAGPGATAHPFSLTLVEQVSLPPNVGKDLAPLNDDFKLEATPNVPLALSCGLSSGQVGSPYTSQLSASGGLPPYVYSIAAGSILPLQLNSQTGAITGTPNVATTLDFTAQVVDSSGVQLFDSITTGCSISIAPQTIPLSLTCPSTSPAPQAGVPYNGALTETGGTFPFTFSIASGSLPAGLFLNPSTGAITGTPQAPGSAAFQGKVVDSSSPAQTALTTGSCNMTVAAPPPVTSNCVSIFAVQGLFIIPVTLTASGGVGGPYTFTATGLPAGLTMSGDGTISGKPTVSGVFPYTVIITDSAGNHGTLNCSVTVNPTSNQQPCSTNLGPVTYNVNKENSQSAGEIVWFNSHLVKLAGTLPTSDFTLYIQNGQITFGTLTLAVPNAAISFKASAAGASTTFDTGSNTWFTTVPLASAAKADEIFAAGLAYQLPTNFAQNVSNVTWSATIYTSSPGLQVSWQYGVSNWLTQNKGTSFPVLSAGVPDYNAMMVNPAHGAPLANPAYNTGDHAGAPEFSGRQNVITGGGSGGGGSNWTGSWSSTPPLKGFICQ